MLASPVGKLPKFLLTGRFRDKYQAKWHSIGKGSARKMATATAAAAGGCGGGGGWGRVLSRPVTFVTGNAKKLEEVRAILGHSIPFHSLKLDCTLSLF